MSCLPLQQRGCMQCHVLLQGGRWGGSRSGRDNIIELVSYCVCDTAAIMEEADAAVQKNQVAQLCRCIPDKLWWLQLASLGVISRSRGLCASCTEHQPSKR